ncbi:hypothetical protein HZ992_14865 [Rhizobacter sp. AJA081-3]|uniref:hypothetical protein n=1 Tax=Rhizobacter sp. AJA081-3 TaxID=2753607 RepID=UPI001ADF406C|nr:hypothetical protein [Rhizobacter sp. AJA081-3]QTN21466.1 hypothetical protein HZ992_14865 [Rhizobacter sp. AJA081-3]
MAMYSYLFRLHLWQPLLESIAGLPMLVRNVIIILAASPIFLLATYALHVLKPSANKKYERSGFDDV